MFEVVFGHCLEVRFSSRNLRDRWFAMQDCKLLLEAGSSSECSCFETSGRNLVSSQWGRFEAEVEERMRWCCIEQQ